jgi:hypothetical protein
MRLLILPMTISFCYECDYLFFWYHTMLVIKIVAFTIALNKLIDTSDTIDIVIYHEIILQLRGKYTLY